MRLRAARSVLFLASGGTMSSSSTGMPALASCAAIPAPISPAPNTAARLMSYVIAVSLPWGRPADARRYSPQRTQRTLRSRRGTNHRDHGVHREGKETRDGVPTVVCDDGLMSAVQRAYLLPPWYMRLSSHPLCDLCALCGFISDLREPLRPSRPLRFTLDLRTHIRSMIVATPWPPPTQSVAMPMRLSSVS